jgi:hypothetical protein
MEHCDEGDIDVTCQCVAERQRLLRCEIEDEPFGQRLDPFILRLFGRVGSAVRGPAVDDDAIGAVLVGLRRVAILAVSLLFVVDFGPRLILGTDEAGFDLELAVGTEGHERSGDGLCAGS